MTFRDWHSAFGSQLDHAGAGLDPVHSAVAANTPPAAESFLGAHGIEPAIVPDVQTQEVGDHAWGGLFGGSPPPSLNDVAFGPVHIVPVHDTYTEGHHFHFGDF